MSEEQIISTTEQEEIASAKETRRQEIAQAFNPNRMKVIRKELFANLRDPAVTIRSGNITFNTACINGLEDVVFVNLMVDEEQGFLSFNVVTGRITIFKTTLAAMEYPEYFRFLFSPEDLVFGIEPCAIDDGGAQRLPDEITREHYDIKSIDLVRFVYQSCGWKKKLTYRVPGEKFAPDSHLVCFDLRRAYEIHEGRMKEV